MPVRGRGSAGRQPSLRQTLVGNARIPVRQEFPDLRAVFGREGRRGVDVAYVHDGVSGQGRHERARRWQEGEAPAEPQMPRARPDRLGRSLARPARRSPV